jgi:hypothetical protein
LILKAIDLGVSTVFMALCTKAFFVHFYKDVKRRFEETRGRGLGGRGLGGARGKAARKIVTARKATPPLAG